MSTSFSRAPCISLKQIVPKLYGNHLDTTQIKLYLHTPLSIDQTTSPSAEQLAYSRSTVLWDRSYMRKSRPPNSICVHNIPHQAEFWWKSCCAYKKSSTLSAKGNGWFSVYPYRQEGHWNRRLKWYPHLPNPTEEKRDWNILKRCLLILTSYRWFASFSTLGTNNWILCHSVFIYYWVSLFTFHLLIILTGYSKTALYVAFRLACWFSYMLCSDIFYSKYWISRVDTAFYLH